MPEPELLHTKLFIPPPRPARVPRPRLIEQLDKGLYRKMTLVSAPAGFGKTTLVSEWVDSLRSEDNKGNQIETRVSWLSLDEGDNDPTRCLSYLIAAIKQIEGIDASFGKGALNKLQSAQSPPTEHTLTSLINELAVTNFKIILVLDDYHVINAQPIHDALGFLLENIPPLMHLAIVTREDPQLPLTRLRASDQLTELRAGDLCFSYSEAAEFLNEVMDLELSDEEISALETRTEGWIVGLQMAALSMQGREDTARFIQAFTGSHYFVLDYLIEEVLQRQSENVLNFLLRTSLLDRLNGPLCDAVTGQKDGNEILEVLERGNLFVLPLDDKRTGYRYHHLFADALQARLMDKQPNRVPVLHTLASEWYEQNGMPSDAIYHALAAEDYERAADLAELAWPEWSGSYQSITWLGWMKSLPEELIRARPVLSVAFAWAHLNAGELESAETRLRDVERWLEPTAETSDQMVVGDENQFQSLPLTFATARAYHAQAIGDLPGTLKYAQQILNLLPEGDHPERGTATALLGLAHWASGDLEAAHQTFSEGLADMKPLDLIVGTFVLADIKATLGRLDEAISTCEHALRLAAEHGEPMPLGTEDVYTGISNVHRERGDLEGAVQDLAASKKLGEQVELADWQYRWCIAQARLKETQGDLDDALDLLDEAERLFVRTPLPKIRPIPALKARVWVRQGRLTDALGWACERGLSVDDDLSYLREFEHVTLARVLIAQYLDDHVNDTIHKAMGLLERLRSAAEEGGRIGSIIEILVLQAIVHEMQDNIPAALVHLERALRLAEPEGYIQIFVDEGPPVARLLYEILSQGIYSHYVQRLLAAFPIDDPGRTVAANAQGAVAERVESLSDREFDVLQLIADGLTNQEIANRLYLSLHTVKGHARNIYGKLGVKNRTQAVARGKALGILPPF